MFSDAQRAKTPLSLTFLGKVFNHAMDKGYRDIVQGFAASKHFETIFREAFYEATEAKNTNRVKEFIRHPMVNKMHVVGLEEAYGTALESAESREIVQALEESSRGAEIRNRFYQFV